MRVGDWVLDGVITEDADDNLIAPAGDEFDALLPARLPGVRLERPKPDKNWEVFVRGTRQGQGGDVQWVIGEFNHNALSLDAIESPMGTDTWVTLGMRRQSLAGVSITRVRGNWLLFAESAVHLDRAVMPDRLSAALVTSGWPEADHALAALGAEFNGWRNLVVTVEYDWQRLLQSAPPGFARQLQTGIGVRTNYTALNDRLRILGVWNRLSNQQGEVLRLSVDYEWQDSLDIGIMWMGYDAGPDTRFYQFRQNDGLQLQMRYNFQY